jgi:hypothetical protein
MENPGGQIIEKLEFNGEEVVVEEAKEVKVSPPSIVRPSSLNYKISLLDAAIAFV